MIEKRTVSQCISADYCRGYNDAVDEIVRCKDCQEAYTNSYMKSDGIVLCKLHGYPRQHDDYCSYGERKDVQS